MFKAFIFLILVVAGLLGYLRGRGWKRPRLRIIYIILFLIVAVAGIKFSLNGYKLLGTELERHRWPSVEGTVINAEVAGERAFHPRVKYSYSVRGVKFIGIDISLAPGFGGKGYRYETAEIIVKDYPPGKSVPVYYNPDNPRESLLAVGLSHTSILETVSGLIVVIIGGFGAGGLLTAGRRIK